MSRIILIFCVYLCLCSKQKQTIIYKYYPYRTDYLEINCNVVLVYACLLWELNRYKKGNFKIYVYSKKKPYDYAPVLFVGFTYCLHLALLYTFVAVIANSCVSFELVSAL